MLPGAIISLTARSYLFAFTKCRCSRSNWANSVHLVSKLAYLTYWLCSKCSAFALSVVAIIQKIARTTVQQSERDIWAAEYATAPLSQALSKHLLAERKTSHQCLQSECQAQACLKEQVVHGQTILGFVTLPTEML